MAKQVWKCDRCHTDYESEAKALDCEEAHPSKNDFRIDGVGFRYLNNLWGPARGEAQFVPNRITISWGKSFGEYATYVLERVGPKGV